MFRHEFNVYETLIQLDNLLENGHDDPSPMDRAEYTILTNKLVHGAVELLRHLAMHDVLTFETAESFELIKHRHISAASTHTDGGFSDELVAIQLPPHLLPYGAILEAMKTWNVGTVETTADLVVLAQLWRDYLAADVDSPEESAIYDQWAGQADRVSGTVLRALQQIHASGLLRIVDLRTENSYPPRLTRIGAHATKLEVAILTEPEEAATSAPARRKKKTQPRRARSLT